MALVVYDRVKETTTTTGTGTITLAGAVTGYQSFAVVGNGNTTYYCIAGRGTAEWEVGIGTYTAAGTTLARTTILASSNANTAVNFSAGTKDVFVTGPAGKFVTNAGDFATGTWGISVSGNAATATTATNQSGGTINATTGTVTPNASGVSSGFNVVNGDITVYRSGGTTGVVYFGTTGGRYLYYDGTNYNMPNGQLDVNSSRVLNAGNYNSYAPTLTGTGASGSWGINITGSAGSASTATTATNVSGGTVSATTGTFSNVVNVAGNAGLPAAVSGTVYWAGGYASPVAGRYVIGDGTGWIMYFSKRSASTTTDLFSFGDTGNFNAIGAITQNGSQVLTAGNYNSYSPTLTGTGASGTWGISVTGNAGVAFNLFGGTANQIPYQGSASSTGFITAPTTASTFLQWTGSAFTWAAAGGGPTQGTAQNTTSGTSITFTGLPSTLKRITLMFNSISTTGTNPFIIQLGTSSGFVTTGYASTGSSATTGVGTLNTTAGLIVVASPPSGGSGATGTFSGLMTIAKLDSTIWTSSASLGQDGINHSTWAAGRGTISGTVTQLRLTTTTGVDTWDSGSMNILYE